MLSTILAIAGTLLGAVVSGVFQHRSAAQSARTALNQQLRRDRLEAVTALATAVSEHRRTMWMRGDAQLKAAPAERVRALKSESHLTRGAVTRPLVALRILVTDPGVRAAADAMVTATYALRDAYTSTGDLTQARETAKDAHDAFVDQAAHYLDTTS